MGERESPSTSTSVRVYGVTASGAATIADHEPQGGPRVCLQGERVRRTTSFQEDASASEDARKYFVLLLLDFHSLEDSRTS